MGDDLGIRFRAEMGVALDQLLLQLEIIFDDAVVHDHDIAGAVRVGVVFRRPAMGCPTAVTDADLSGYRLAFQRGGEIVEFALARRTDTRPYGSTAMPAES